MHHTFFLAWLTVAAAPLAAQEAVVVQGEKDIRWQEFSAADPVEADGASTVEPGVSREGREGGAGGSAGTFSLGEDPRSSRASEGPRKTRRCVTDPGGTRRCTTSTRYSFGSSEEGRSAAERALETRLED